MLKKFLFISIGTILIGMIIIAIIIYCNVVPSCRYSSISFRVTVNNEQIMTCNDAYISLLSPSNGGYRFHCGNEASIYIIYATESKPAVNGTIKMIWITGGYYAYQGEDFQTFHTPYFVPDDKIVHCPLAQSLHRTAGELPLSITFWGDIKKGKYTVMLAKPCGQLILEIAEPKLNG
jgi:hypothetical protein